MPACLAAGMPGPPSITLVIENVRNAHPDPGLPAFTGNRAAGDGRSAGAGHGPPGTGPHPSTKGCAPAAFDDNDSCADTSLDEPPTQRPASNARPATQC